MEVGKETMYEWFYKKMSNKHVCNDVNTGGNDFLIYKK